MKQSLKKRLDRIEAELVPKQAKSGVVFIPLNGESNAECRARMERWRVGQKVEGMDCAYTGQHVGIVRYVMKQK